jgi:hypothetical protein
VNFVIKMNNTRIVASIRQPLAIAYFITRLGKYSDSAGT